MRRTLQVRLQLRGRFRRGYDNDFRIPNSTKSVTHGSNHFRFMLGQPFNTLMISNTPPPELPGSDWLPVSSILYAPRSRRLSMLRDPIVPDARYHSGPSNLNTST